MTENPKPARSAALVYRTTSAGVCCSHIVVNPNVAMAWTLPTRYSAETPDLIRPNGSITGMAKEKATITLDRAKAAAARALLQIDSNSEVIDVALDQLIQTARLRADIAAYRRMPPTPDEVELASLGDTGGLADDTDWEALYPDELP
jgi:hypothetical protein